MSKPKEIFLPSLDREIVAVHPINQSKFELLKLLTSFGFEVAEGPEIESEEYNFDMLNIPATHPAREMHDTFYVDGMKNVLRTHTSPVQVRCMLQKQGPMAFVSPGKVYSTMYIATNKTSSKIVGQAIPSVSPNEASRYLKKIECFCFEEQTFKPGEVVKLPLYFAIDEKLPNRIKTVTLSYSCFESLNVSKKK